MPKSRRTRQIAEAESSDIVVYPDRHEMINWLVLSAFCTLASAVFTITPILLVIFMPDVRAQGGQGGAIVVAMMMAVFFLASAWMTCLMFSLAFSGEPVLVINREGIRVAKFMALLTLFFPGKKSDRSTVFRSRSIPSSYSRSITRCSLLALAR